MDWYRDVTDIKTDGQTDRQKWKFKAEDNVSPPGAVSPTGENLDVEIPFVAMSRGPSSNALTYAKHTLGLST